MYSKNVEDTSNEICMIGNGDSADSQQVSSSFVRLTVVNILQNRWGFGPYKDSDDQVSLKHF